MKRKTINPFPYSDSNKRYHTYDYYLRCRYGRKCAKVPLDGGFTCPNLDGTLSDAGCTFCTGRGSGDFCADRALSVEEQFQAIKNATEKKWGKVCYIPYFQAFSATWGDFSHMCRQFEAALALPDTVGLHIATRPDCLPPRVLDYLESLSRRCDLTVELGLQSIHDATLRRINRGHSYRQFLDGFAALRARGISVCVHLINGLPGENEEMMLQTAREMARLRPQMLKIHSLCVFRNTQLEHEYRAGAFSLLSRAQYVSITCRQLQLLPPQTVIARIMGDGAAAALVAPQWCQRKLTLLNEIDKWFAANNTYQGALYSAEHR